MLSDFQPYFSEKFLRKQGVFFEGRDMVLAILIAGDFNYMFAKNNYVSTNKLFHT